MATFTRTVAATITDDVTWRAWAQSVSDALSTLLVRTADGGQIAQPIAAARPAINTAAGYEVFRFNDVRQTDAPLFLKVEYASGTGLTIPGIYLTVGRATDGAGGVTGVLHARTLITRSAAPLANAETFACHADGSLALVWGVQNTTTSTSAVVLVVERTRAAGGAPDTSGVAVLLTTSNASTPTSVNAYAYDGTWTDIRSWALSLVPNTVGSLFKGEIVTYPIYTLVGYARAAMLGAIIVNPTDVAGLATFAVDLHGGSHTFRSVGTSSIGALANAAWGIAVRYEA